ncbi:hypothetical protein ACIBI9_65545 [Nonomuraea sp. NPDC050451]|uniref:hypothetical protein n=1 Tax=Nonomuraea sp. NPDC050451 TaxID=3364364 RepID=UPI0037A774FA
MTSSRFPRTRPTSGHQHPTLTRVPRSPRPGFDEPARFRLLHHCEVIAINGPSYRLKNRLAAVEAEIAATG